MTATVTFENLYLLF